MFWGLGGGVTGVAAATALADVVAFGFGLWLARRILRRVGGTYVKKKILDASMVRRAVVLNLDIFVRTICLVSAFAYFTAQRATFGNVILAANAVLLNFQTFMAHALDGFAHAAEAMCGRAVGAKDRAGFREAARVSMLWGGFAAAGFAVIYFIAGLGIVELLTGIEVVRKTAREYLIWSVIMPLVAVFPFVFDGIFLGATKGRIMRKAMIWSLCIYVAVCFALIPVWANHGLWAALLIFMGARGLTLAIRYPSLERSVGTD